MGGLMKTTYLIMGAIGSGKSAVADFILSSNEFDNIDYVGSDIYKRKYFNQNIKSDKLGYRCADELVFYRIENICKSKMDFAYELCPTNVNKIETIKNIIKKYDYKIGGH
jgi:predicted ABC-type ATPase